MQFTKYLNDALNTALQEDCVMTKESMSEKPFTALLSLPSEGRFLKTVTGLIPNSMR